LWKFLTLYSVLLGTLFKMDGSQFAVLLTLP